MRRRFRPSSTQLIHIIDFLGGFQQIGGGLLLRAGLLYILGVASLLLGALAAWQGLQLASPKDGAVTFSERTARTQRDPDAARLEAEMAQRRALVANRCSF